jgi:hypothetical protein
VIVVDSLRRWLVVAAASHSRLSSLPPQKQKDAKSGVKVSRHKENKISNSQCDTIQEGSRTRLSLVDGAAPCGGVVIVAYDISCPP